MNTDQVNFQLETLLLQAHFDTNSFKQFVAGQIELKKFSFQNESQRMSRKRMQILCGVMQLKTLRSVNMKSRASFDNLLPDLFTNLDVNNVVIHSKNESQIKTLFRMFPRIQHLEMLPSCLTTSICQRMNDLQFLEELTFKGASDKFKEFGTLTLQNLKKFQWKHKGV